MQIFKGKSYSDTRKNFSEKNFRNFLGNFFLIWIVFMERRRGEIQKGNFFFSKNYF